MNPVRELVYEKYGGKCAYCGCDLNLEDMEIDHFYPKAKGGSENLENLMPSCHPCNRYKDSDNIHGFRHKIKKIGNRLKKHILGDLAMRHNMLELKEFDQFYYEKVEQMDELTSENVPAIVLPDKDSECYERYEHEEFSRKYRIRPEWIHVIDVVRHLPQGYYGSLPRSDERQNGDDEYDEFLETISRWVRHYRDIGALEGSMEMRHLNSGHVNLETCPRCMAEDAITDTIRIFGVKAEDILEAIRDV